MANKYYFPQERLSILPIGVTERPAPKAKLQPLKEYHAQIPGCSEVAGCVVKDNKVKMTAAQAQYWLDQGVIGESAGEHKAGALLPKPAPKTKK